ncbi:Protein H24K24.3 b [Aphelenchoides avenae]|nr:Protein H24K24.3 b [Aphelenchus avenae]
MASSCTKIRLDAPLETVCLLSCGVGTGYGAATKACKVEAGSRCAVWGIGGVGLSVVMGCKAAGASQIVAVDVCPSKFDIAKRLGATEYVNPLTIPKNKTVSQYLLETFDGGFDYTFECIGKEETAMDALASAQVGSGVTCLIGVPSKGVELKVSPMEFIVGKTLKGCLFGGHKPHEDLPKLVEAHMAGKMPLDEIVSHRMKLEDINKAFDLLYKGEWWLTHYVIAYISMFSIRVVMEVGSK